MSDEDEPLTHESIAADSHVMCTRCGVKIYYDVMTSWWMDGTGVPGCAPDGDGNVLQHDPDWTPEFKAMRDDDEDEDDYPAEWPS